MSNTPKIAAESARTTDDLAPSKLRDASLAGGSPRRRFGFMRLLARMVEAHIRSIESAGRFHPF